MDIQDMRIFARVAAVQNLSAVGTELGLTPGTISKRIQALETSCPPACSTAPRARSASPRRAHVPRPRRAHPGRDRGGARQRGRQGEQAQGQAQDRGARRPRPALRRPGPVRVHARVSRDRGAARPQDRPVNLQEDGYDVAIRTGALSDSSPIAKRLAPDKQQIGIAVGLFRLSMSQSSPYISCAHTSR